MIDSEYERSRIERAKQDLEGKPAGTAEKIGGGTLSPHNIPVTTDWATTATSVAAVKKTSVHVSIFKWFLFFLIFCFTVSIGFFIYKVAIEDPNAKPSEKNVSIRVDGPVAVAAGEEAKFKVTVSNKNRIPLAYANIVVSYPDGAQTVTDITKSLRDSKKILGGVPSGGEGVFETSAVFLGQEKEEKKVQAHLEYRMDGMSSSFTKDELFIVHISASPINVVVDALKEVTAGQEFSLKINIDSNARETLSNVLLKVDYPFGFQYTDASVKPSFGNNVWKISDLTPGEKSSISIRGTLAGEDNQEKVFRVYAGAQGDQEYAVGQIYGSVLSGITLNKPFITTTLELDEDTSDIHVVEFGKKINGMLSWKNNLQSRVTSGLVEVKLKGTLLDRKSISVKNGGLYRSSDDTIVWNERETASLASIDAGSGDRVLFSFGALPAVTNDKLFRNPEIELNISVKGKRTSESGVPEEVHTLLSRKVRFTTDLNFSSRAVHTLAHGTIKNTGPIPPRVDQKTTYTVIWSLVNSSNNVANTVVKARLPSYVTWEKHIYPDAEDIRYNENDGTITWNVGELTAGTGIVNAPKQIAFQISITPSIGQLGATPQLLSAAKVTGTDTFTNAAIQKEIKALTTAAETDPGVSRTGGVVIE